MCCLSFLLLRIFFDHCDGNMNNTVVEHFEDPEKASLSCGRAAEPGEGDLQTEPGEPSDGCQMREGNARIA